MNARSIIDDIIRREGSAFTNRPADRGGPTKYGITQKTLSRWYQEPATEADVRELKEEEARRIYRALYVVDPGFDRITEPDLAALLIDSGVQHGPKTAIRWLQHAVGATADGIIGPKTLEAVSDADPDEVYSDVFASRLRYYGSIITHDQRQAVFAAGWMNRLAGFVPR